MTLNDLQRAALVLFAAREVGPKGSLEQMKAICYCMRNRVRTGWHDGSWIACIEHAHEEAAHLAPDASFTDINSRAVQRLMHDIDDLYYGQSTNGDDGMGLEESIGTQKFWMFLDRPNTVTEWFTRHIISDQVNHPSHSQMGLMLFFE